MRPLSILGLGLLSTLIPLSMKAQAQTSPISIPIEKPSSYDAVQAKPELREVSEGEPNSPEDYANLARTLRSQAADAYREVIRLAPGDPSIWPNGIEQYLPLSEISDAYYEAIRLAPERTQNYSDLGRIFRSRRYYADAIEVYQQAIQVEDTLDGFNNLDSLYADLGIALLERGQYKEAVEAFRTAFERAPYENTTHLGLLAIALRKQGDIDGAEAVYRQIIQVVIDYKQRPRRPHTDTSDVDSVENVRLPDEVIKYPNATGDSELSRAYTGLGRFLAKQGRLTEAEEVYEQALSVSFPDDDHRVSLTKAHAYESLGDLYREQGREEEATEMFRTIQTWFPEYFERYGLSVDN